ncbi:MAG: 50S ribosomal protein L44e [Candidatus Altiarchaeota archaeon]|nr:50S ribosomal protein L44e [Candidatus Altiarchaeota archaeon]
MKLPKEIKTHCPFCRKHTLQKLVVVKKRERGVLSGGQRRFLRVMKGYRGFPRPKAEVVKQTKRIDIRLKCPDCNKMHTKRRTFRTKKFEIKR